MENFRSQTLGSIDAILNLVSIAAWLHCSSWYVLQQCVKKLALHNDYKLHYLAQRCSAENQAHRQCPLLLTVDGYNTWPF